MEPDSNTVRSSGDGDARSQTVTTPSGATRAFEERHYSVAEVAAMWNLSVDAVRKLFRNEPGVLLLGNGKRRGTRGYTTLRIPESVLERVYRQKVLGQGAGSR